LHDGAICGVFIKLDYNLMWCLYSRFKPYPNSVTKVLQTLRGYLDRAGRVKKAAIAANDWLSWGLTFVAPASRRLSRGHLPSRCCHRPSCCRTAGRTAAGTPALRRNLSIPTVLSSPGIDRWFEAGRHSPGPTAPRLDTPRPPRELQKTALLLSCGAVLCR
jgi:hypothetical protein